MIISSPKPTIDVFYQLKIGSQGLLYGQNPYSMSYPQIYDYPQDYFPYLPLTLLAVLPFNVLLSDPRYALVVANIISALVIYKLFDKKHSVEKEVLPLILLFNPQQTFMIEQSWIDPLIFTFFCLFIFSIEKKYSWITSTIFLTFVIGIKQIFLFILIFIYLYKKIQKKILVSALIISIFSILFFFLWNPQDFTNDVFLNHVNRINWWHNSLTLNSFVHAIFKINIPIYLFLILWTFALFGFLKIKAENLASLVLAITGFLFTFYVFNYQAYIHYYALVSNLMILSMTLNKNDGSA